MENLSGKKIILGVTGSIAAYKTAILVRLLKKQGAEVQVVATASALSFITPLTLATLSEKPVLSEFEKTAEGVWNNHVSLGLWADLFVVAPLSAQTMAKMAHGFCDNLLLATYLSARCPVMLAPAMDLDMFAHPATQHNLEMLVSRGHKVVEPATGELASGLHGKGRMAEPEELLAQIQGLFTTGMPLAGKSVLITAGPTHEFIDPVRYIGNGSSGKMGYALAETLATWGATVQLVSGPVSMTAQHPNISTTPITSAKEMLAATQAYYPKADIAIFAAAVADYTPANPSDYKLKKSGDALQLNLIKNPDIAAEMGKLKRKGQLNIGFALETHDEMQHAEEKLRKKKFDFVVLNSLKDEGAGFGHDTNKVTIVREGHHKPLPLDSKKAVALAIAKEIVTELEAHQNRG